MHEARQELNIKVSCSEPCIKIITFIVSSQGEAVKITTTTWFQNG